MAVDSFVERGEPGSGSAWDDSHAAPILQTLGTTTSASVDRGKWAVALKQIVRQLFPAS
jgi:hypothetical protein